MSNEQVLFDIKRKIEARERKYQEATGALKECKKSLKDKFNLSSVKEAEKELDKLNKEIEDMTQEINDGLDELEDKYDL